MSKSLGNTILAENFAQKYGPNALRYLILNSHYNQVINLSEELILYLYAKKKKVIKQKPPQEKKIITNLLDNLNTVKVLFFLEQTINSLNKSIDKRENDSKQLQEMINNFYFIIDLLGFKFDLVPYNLESKALIKDWQELRKKGDYQQADKIRKKLQEMDII